MWHRIRALFSKPKPQPIKTHLTLGGNSTFTKEQVRKLIEVINSAVAEPDHNG